MIWKEPCLWWTARTGFSESSLIYQAIAKPETASATAEADTAFAILNHNASLLQDAKAFQAELAFRQNRLPAAAHWAKTCDPFPLNPVVRYYLPPLTLLKVWIAKDSRDTNKQAAELADRLIDYYTATNNSRVIVKVLALQALLKKTWNKMNWPSHPCNRLSVLPDQAETAVRTEVRRDIRHDRRDRRRVCRLVGGCKSSLL